MYNRAHRHARSEVYNPIYIYLEGTSNIDNVAYLQVDTYRVTGSVT